MRPKCVNRIAAMIAALLAIVLAGPAWASDTGEPSFAPICHFASDDNLELADVVQGSSQWICEDRKWAANQPIAWLRFDAESWEGEERPRFFFSRIARFEAIDMAALDKDGSFRSVSHLESDGQPFGKGPVFQLRLPDVTQDTQSIFVRIQRPHSVPLLTEARLMHFPEDADWSQVEVMLLAMVVGMLVLPLLFDISFFVVLRERFVALHAVMVVAMITYVTFAGGLISVFVTLPVSTIAIIGPLAWAIGCGVSALFLAEFLEPGSQSRAMQKLTIGTGIWCMLVPGFFALQLHTTQAIDDRAYFYAFLPVIFVITAAIGEALWRGSRAAKFIAIAWAPIILASIDRLMRGLGAYVGPSSLDQSLYLATGFEVILISLAVADRFLALRRERDEAITEARTLERLSVRDHLTGLMNRRALDDRFVQYHRDGYETFALFDLDHFKRVNDSAGHAVGDSVLKTIALTLNEDDDTLAFRLGGEEFVVMLRGEDGERRIEQLRQAITLRVARAVPELKQLVTASVGLLQAPYDSIPKIRFADLYRRADMLMYEAKELGRNRIVSERWQGFSARSDDDRRQIDRRRDEQAA